MIRIKFDKQTLTPFTGSSKIIIVTSDLYAFFINDKFNMIVKKLIEEDEVYPNGAISFNIADLQKLILYKKADSVIGTIAANSSSIEFKNETITEQIPYLLQLPSGIPKLLTTYCIPLLASNIGIEVNDFVGLDKASYLICTQQLTSIEDRTLINEYYLCRKQTNIDHEVCLFKKIKNTSPLPIKIVSLSNQNMPASGKLLINFNEEKSIIFIIDGNKGYTTEHNIALQQESRTYKYWFDYEINNQDDVKDISFLMDYIKELVEDANIKSRIVSLLSKKDRKFVFNADSNSFQIILANKKTIDFSINLTKVKITKNISISSVLINACIAYASKITSIKNLTKAGQNRLIYKIDLNDDTSIIIY